MSSRRSQVLGPLDVGHKDKKEITGVGTAKLVQAMVRAAVEKVPPSTGGDSRPSDLLTPGSGGDVSHCLGLRGQQPLGAQQAGPCPESPGLWLSAPRAGLCGADLQGGAGAVCWGLCLFDHGDVFGDGEASGSHDRCADPSLPISPLGTGTSPGASSGQRACGQYNSCSRQAWSMLWGQRQLRLSGQALSDRQRPP